MQGPRPGVFVTGTGTGIGKTLVSACLVRRWNAAYWKPVQTGCAEEPGDTDTIAALTGAACPHAPRFTYQAPLSPQDAAAAQDAPPPRLDAFSTPPGAAPIVVEGAGGVLVPLNEAELMADLMARLGLPVILVAGTALGTINHTLLSLEALRSRAIRVAGVVLSGPSSPHNRAAIAHHGRARILHELPPLGPVTPDAVRHAAASFPSLQAVLDA